MAFAIAFTVVSCGDDDPIPTPTPTPDPEPETPTVTYNGYSYVLAFDAIASRDVERAQHAARVHIENAEHTLLRSIAEPKKKAR